MSPSLNGLPSDAREPYCIHTLLGGPHQPASHCVLCRGSAEMAAWKAYWASHPEKIPEGR